MKYIILAIMMLATATVFFFQKSDISEIQQKIPIWSPIEVSDVATIKITMAAKETIVIHWAAGEWQLNDHVKADHEAVERLLKDLAEMRPVRVVTRKHKHDEKLRLDAKSGVHLLLLDAADRDIFNAMVGKQGANLLSTYLRLQGSDVVIAMDKSLNWQVYRSIHDWEETTLKSSTPETN
ncbi:MAG: DUF4340 domain-containing protein [Mariprofundaceae bacterium]|nr:DUF4340 domain-containing protein [Mariprofundaceae bacterium]